MRTQAKLVPRNSQGKTLPGVSTDPKLSELQQKVWYMCAILQYSQIKTAQQLGISQQYVSDIMVAVRKLIPQQTKEDIIQERIEQLRVSQQALMPKVARGDPEATRVWLKVLEREARLLGYDAPAKLAVRASMGEDGMPIVNFVIDGELAENI